MNNKPFGWLYTLNWEPIREYNVYTVESMPDDFTGINHMKDGTYYRLNGLRHRIDGPAIEYPNCEYKHRNRYYLFGKSIDVPSNEAFILYVNLLKLKGIL